MAAGVHADEAILTTFFPADPRFEALDEPRTLPDSWRADRFDRADRRATEATYYAVLAVRGRYDGLGGTRHTLRVLYVADDLSATSYRDYQIEERDGYRPRADKWRCTLALSMGFGDVDPIAGVEREVLQELLDEQYPDARGER
jgi:hypothetical protein